MIGRTISRYHILEPLGRGGMATVWKARDDLLGRTVAIKLLDETIASDPVSRRRFRREAEIAALLEHPSIVPVYDAGESGETAFLVMKLVEGETLARFVARRLQPIDEVLRVAASVADALGYAHARGVIHRDVTPRNIMLTGNGDVYVLDFGLASVAGQSKSTTGHIVGTPAYMAPETLSGGTVDGRSDVYGLGVVLYEALTGATPFQGDRPEIVGYAILHGVVEPPSRLRPEVDSAVDAVVMRALSREPDGRHADAGELMAALLRLRAPLIESASYGGEPGAQRSTGSASIVAGDDLAGRAATGRTQTYLVVLPVVASADGEIGDDRRRVLEGLTEAARAALAHTERLHVVVAGTPIGDEDTRAFARRVGANLILRSTARFVGGAVRITFALIDPERDVQVAGGNVDGSTFQPFELEDRLVASVRAALGFKPSATDEAWRSRPHDPAARERYAQALGYLRRFDHEASIDGAIALLGGLLATEGESAVVHATMARACLHKYRETKQRVWESRAAQSCERAAKLDPSLPDVMLAVGELHTAAGRNDEALRELDRVVAVKPDFYEAHVSRARALDGANRAVEAEQACRRAIALRADDWRAYHELGLILFRHGRYAEAVGPWRRVTELTPDNATGHRNLGSAFYQLERYDQSLAAFDRSIEIRPHTMAFRNRGTALFFLGLYEESIAAFEKAVALNPADAFAWGDLGNACRRMPSHEGRMREALERAIALTRDRLDRGPGEARDWSRLAGWLANLGRNDEAESAIRHALAMAPDEVHSMVEAGKVFLRLGARTEALGWLRRAVESGHGVDELRRSPELRALEGDAEFARILEQGSPARGVAENEEIERGRP